MKETNRKELGQGVICRVRCHRDQQIKLILNGRNVIELNPLVRMPVVIPLVVDVLVRVIQAVGGRAADLIRLVDFCVKCTGFDVVVEENANDCRVTALFWQDTSTDADHHRNTCAFVVVCWGVVVIVDIRGLDVLQSSSYDSVSIDKTRRYDSTVVTEGN